MNDTWKLLAALGTLNLIVGLVVVGIGAAYDFSGQTPGNIAMIGVGLAATPWLALSKHLHHRLKVQQAKDARALAEHPHAVVEHLSRTGAYRTLEALEDIHGDILRGRLPGETGGGQRQ